MSRIKRTLVCRIVRGGQVMKMAFFHLLSTFIMTPPFYDFHKKIPPSTFITTPPFYDFSKSFTQYISVYEVMLLGWMHIFQLSIISRVLSLSYIKINIINIMLNMIVIFLNWWYNIFSFSIVKKHLHNCLYIQNYNKQE